MRNLTKNQSKNPVKNKYTQKKYLQFSINDVSWNKFTQMLAYKAEEAGCRLSFVNPKNTSKRCSGCGNIQEMPLSKREYNCEKCGLKIGRDYNAALNILHKALHEPQDLKSQKTNNINTQIKYLNTLGQREINACGIGGLPLTMKQEPSGFQCADNDSAGSSTL